jgi:hypothetical protein
MAQPHHGWSISKYVGTLYKGLLGTYWGTKSILNTKMVHGTCPMDHFQFNSYNYQTCVLFNH